MSTVDTTMKVVGDLTPGYVALTTPEVPGIDPYLQLAVLVVSLITAIVRLWKSAKQTEND